MRSMGIIGIIIAAIGLWFSFAALGSQYDETLGYGVFGILFYGYFLALSIVGVKK